MAALTVDELLAAPHGRRLCLAFAELACQALATIAPEEHWRSHALFQASHVLDPGVGTSRVMLYVAGGESAPPPDNSGARQAEVIGEVVSALADLSLPESTPELLLEALAMCVEDARYWQPPVGVHVLAAAPELGPPLERVAAHILASPASGWWAEDMVAAPQWLSSFGLGASPETGPRDTGAILARWADHVTQLEVVGRREREADPTAARSGEWWSIPPYGLLESTRALDRFGPLRLHLKEDSNGPEAAAVTQVGWPESARVFELRGPGDWAVLCRIGSISVVHEKRLDWHRATGEERDWIMPDWRIVAKQFDAVHLSVAGYLTSAGRAIDCGPGSNPARPASVIAGWDPGVTYWLNDVARQTGAVVHWERMEPDTHINVEAWRPSSDAASPGRRGE